MRKYTTALNLIGMLSIFIGLLFIAFCSMVSDPEIEGESVRTPLSAYFLSLTPILFGILLLIISYKSNKKKITD